MKNCNPKEIIADRYEIIEYLDEGGMQEVYRAKDLRLNREIALKTPKNSSAEKRFQRSAIVSARINHPNIAKTLDYIECDDNYYLIEELIKGIDLKSITSQYLKIIDPYLAARILHHLAKGVSVAHHAGVVHRDLKPNNIMIVGGLKFSEIKVTDFGIAKLAEQEISGAVEDGTSSMGNSKTFIGAIPYMAPELIEKNSQVTQAVDIWAIGAIIYELISGNLPFGGNGNNIVEVIQNVFSNPLKIPDKPSSLNQTQFETLGNQLYEIVISCLQKDPDSRPKADDLVKCCESLCYPIVPRYTGTFNNFVSNRNNQGFIKSDDGSTVFFHFDSVYGSSPKVGQKVYFSEFSGTPRNRAHPVIVMRD